MGLSEELGKMLKGFGADIAGKSADDVSKTIFKEASNASSNTAGSWAKIGGGLFLGRKYANGAYDWYRYGSIASKLGNISSTAGKMSAGDLAKTIKGTAFEGMNIKDIFSGASELAKNESAAGKSAFGRRFTNKAGEYTAWSLTKASARIGMPILAVTAPYKGLNIVTSGIRNLVPHTPQEAGQVAGQQW